MAAARNLEHKDNGMKSPPSVCSLIFDFAPEVNSHFQTQASQGKARSSSLGNLTNLLASPLRGDGIPAATSVPSGVVNLCQPQTPEHKKHAPDVPEVLHAQDGHDDA